MSVKNPVLRGFHPDPSVCRVGEDYYLVNSTFEFFPGVPVYHSKNLVNWQLCGHCLTTPEQLPLENCPTSRGIYAPTIRYHDGTFFMITTNKAHGGNFVVHASDPRGPWSAPAWIDQGGIDPSLMWDEDGKCYYCSTGQMDGHRATVAFQIDPFTGAILSEKHDLGTGCGGQCPEGPHLYRIGAWYYLLFAEGGTGYGHRVTIHRSKTVFGPYQAYAHNPILTHMERKGDPIQATGHADLFEDQNGNWWLVCLGVRNFGPRLQLTLGRETFLAPVQWTPDGWPVVPGGHLTQELDQSRLPAPAAPQQFDFHLDMRAPAIDPRLIHLRNPHPADYRLHNGALLLHGRQPLDDPGCGSPTMLCLRQAEFCARAQAVVRTADLSAARAGLSVFQNDCYHNDVYLSRQRDGTIAVGFARSVHDLKLECVRVPAPQADQVTLFVHADRERYRFGYVDAAGQDVPLGSVTLPNLAQESMGVANFTGVTLAVYAENGDAALLDYRVWFDSASCG